MKSRDTRNSLGVRGRRARQFPVSTAGCSGRLRPLVQQGPQQLERLRRIHQSPDAYAANYRDTLRDAIDELTDTLDGAAKALSDQEKKFGELKRDEKATARAVKERAKEEKKRTKQEKKILKRERKRHGPAESDED